MEKTLLSLAPLCKGSSRIAGEGLFLAIFLLYNPSVLLCKTPPFAQGRLFLAIFNVKLIEDSPAQSIVMIFPKMLLSRNPSLLEYPRPQAISYRSGRSFPCTPQYANGAAIQTSL